MKISKNVRARIENALWLIGGLIWAVLAFHVYTLTMAIILVVIVTILVVYAKPIVRYKALWQNKRDIRLQANAHQRGYILQRLEMLPYSQMANGVAGYAVRDPSSEVTLTISRHPDRRLSIRYLIEFTDEEYVSAAQIGNKYKCTSHSYVLSPKWSSVHYAETISFRLSDKSQYRDREETLKELDHLPDDVIDRIEKALNSWEPLTQ